MANRLGMAQVHTIGQLLKLGWSARRIARELQVHRTTVSRYARAGAAGSSSNPTISTAGSASGSDPPPDPKPTIPTAGSPGRQSLCNPFRDTILEQRELGLTAQRIWQDLVSERSFLGSYQSVKRFVRALDASTPLPFRRLETAPGEEAQVDFGQGAWTSKPGSKRRRRPHLLRIVLSFSRKAYSEVVWKQTTDEFIRALENAFRCFGGAPKTLILDNLKAAVAQADWFDPTLTKKFEDFCRFYGIVALPTKPRTPRHKGKVERGVDYAQENALKGKTFQSLAEQNAHLREWEAKVADLRIHGTTKRQVRALFESLEKPALLPLPLDRFPSFEELERIVAKDGHVAVKQAYYSVPPEFLGRTVWVRVDQQLVRVFDRRFQEIAVHVRVDPGRFSTKRAHLADEKISCIEHGVEWLLERAAKIGEESARFAQALVKERGIHGIRALQGFLALTRKHSWSELERAASIALSHGALRLQTLRHLLAHPSEQKPQIEFLETHPLIRDPQEYGDLVRDAFEAVAERSAS